MLTAITLKTNWAVLKYKNNAEINKLTNHLFSEFESYINDIMGVFF